MSTIFYYVSGFGTTEDGAHNSFMKDLIHTRTSSPKDNIKIRCHPKYSSGVKCIADTYCCRDPLQGSAFVNGLYKEIIIYINKEEIETVIIFGLSLGGAIVNKVATLLNGSKDIDGNKNVNLRKLHIATFGSIYMAPEENIDNLNMFNYLSIGDVAIKCNQVVPARLDRMNIYLFIDKNIVCRLLKENTTKLIQLCLYENNKPLCLDHSVSILNWEEHNYYIQVMVTILINFNEGNPNFINIYASTPKFATDLGATKISFDDEEYDEDEEIPSINIDKIPTNGIPYLLGYTSEDAEKREFMFLPMKGGKNKSRKYRSRTYRTKKYKTRKYKTRKYRSRKCPQ